MDTYSKMRQEIATALSDADLTIDNILNIVDSVVHNYSITKRERNCQTSLGVLEEYISCCKYEKMSEGTIENYQLVLNGLLNSLNVPINEIRTVDLREYLQSYQNQRGIADSTANKYREYFRAFFGWCINKGHCECNPAATLKPIRCEKKQREFFTQFPTFQDTESRFAPDIIFVEAPDYVFEGWGYDETAEGDAHFIKPQAPEGFIYDERTGTFYPENEEAPKTQEEILVEAVLTKMAQAYEQGVQEA